MRGIAASASSRSNAAPIYFASAIALSIQPSAVSANMTASTLMALDRHVKG
jgi:hypothetical protein